MNGQDNRECYSNTTKILTSIFNRLYSAYLGEGFGLLGMGSVIVLNAMLILHLLTYWPIFPMNTKDISRRNSFSGPPGMASLQSLPTSSWPVNFPTMTQSGIRAPAVWGLFPHHRVAHPMGVFYTDPL